MTDDTAKLIRTHYEDDALWAQIAARASAETPEGEAAEFTPVSDKDLDGATPEELAEIYGAEPILYIVDGATHAGAEYPILVVDPDSGDSFRLCAGDAWYVETGLTLGELAFDECLAACDGAGVFRLASIS